MNKEQAKKLLPLANNKEAWEGLKEVPDGPNPAKPPSVDGGGIGIGAAPTAGEAGFTGNLN